MIARLKGIIDELGLDWLVIDVAGVGYFVSCPTRTINLLPGAGLPVDLFIETHVRESQISLFGFQNSRERECFRVLTTVHGVGARVALSILSSLSPDQLVEAIYSQDKAKLSMADGVGPRLAARLLTELKESIASVSGGMQEVYKEGLEIEKVSTKNGKITSDAISALVNLGYGRSEAYRVISRLLASSSEYSSLEVLIPAALKELGND